MSCTPWLTVPAAHKVLADLLKKEVAELEDRWITIAEMALAQSHADLVGPLLARGYSAAQLNALSDTTRLGYAKSQFIFRAGLAAGGLGAYSYEAVMKFDMREHLMNLLIAFPGADCEAQIPDGTSGVGGIAHGRLDAFAGLDADPGRPDLFR